VPNPPTLADVARWERLGDAERARAFEAACLDDGLPLARPTCAAIEAAVTAARLDPGEIVATLPPLFRAATAESIAVCAVVAGCDPAWFPVVVAAARGLADPRFNALGVTTTTGSAAIAVIVNGPVACSFNSRGNLLGPGHRANATVGRAVALTVRAVAGAVPGLTDMATMGQPGKYTLCFAENEGESPWEPLHVSRGLSRGQSAATVFAVSGTLEVTNVHAAGADDILDTIAAALYLPGTLDFDGAVVSGGRVALVVSPEWARALAAEGLSRREVASVLAQRATWPAAMLPEALRRARAATTDTDIHGAGCAEDILLVVGGGVGIKQTILPGWSGGSVPVTVPVELSPV
jgi:hypothetical protein